MRVFKPSYLTSNSVVGELTFVSLLSVFVIPFIMVIIQPIPSGSRNILIALLTLFFIIAAWILILIKERDLANKNTIVIDGDQLEIHVHALQKDKIENFDLNKVVEIAFNSNVGLSGLKSIGITYNLKVTDNEGKQNNIDLTNYWNFGSIKKVLNYIQISFPSINTKMGEQTLTGNYRDLS